MHDLPRSVPITGRSLENENNVTLHLGIQMDFTPGQFVMVWIPGVDEKPFSIAGQDALGLMITVKRRGCFSSAISDIPEGSLVGVRGPYGRGFRLVEPGCLIAGGCGFACLAPIADRFPGMPILYGENEAKDLVYRQRFPHTRFYTADGSEGKKGFPTDDLEAFLREDPCEMVYGCGPEPMLVKMIRICQSLGVSCQVSIERYMKCGQGVCGQCACGSVLACVDGTVFDGEELLQNPDFGRRKLNAAGAWEYLAS